MKIGWYLGLWMLNSWRKEWGIHILSPAFPTVGKGTGMWISLTSGGLYKKILFSKD